MRELLGFLPASTPVEGEPEPQQPEAAGPEAEPWVMEPEPEAVGRPEAEPWVMREPEPEAAEPEGEWSGTPQGLFREAEIWLPALIGIMFLLLELAIVVKRRRASGHPITSYTESDHALLRDMLWGKRKYPAPAAKAPTGEWRKPGRRRVSAPDLRRRKQLPGPGGRRYASDEPASPRPPQPSPQMRTAAAMLEETLHEDWSRLILPLPSDAPLARLHISAFAIIALALCPPLLMSTPALFSAFWPHSDGALPPGTPPDDVNEIAASVITAAGLVYAIVVGATYTWALDKQKEMGRMITLEVDLLDQLLILASTFTSKTWSRRRKLRVWAFIRAAAVNIAYQMVDTPTIAQMTDYKTAGAC